MADYYTDTWTLMQAVKYNLREYTSNSNALRINDDINFGLGFVFPRTEFPAITVFPVEKRFGPRRGNRVPVEYTLNIDSYSPLSLDIKKAKEWALKVSDDIQECVKYNNTLTDVHGAKNCFSTEVVNVTNEELPSENGRDFQITSTVTISCKALHTFNTGTRSTETAQATDSDSFLDIVYNKVKDASMISGIRDWQNKIAKPHISSPIVQVLPGNELIDEDLYAGDTTIVKRPVNFYVVSNGVPRTDAIKNNIRIADELVSTIESVEQLDSYAVRGIIEGIIYDYTSSSAGFEFYSGISTLYDTKKKF